MKKWRFWAKVEILGKKSGDFGVKSGDLGQKVNFGGKKWILG